MVSALTCTGVSKWFGSTQVLDRVDLTIEAGEIHALLGENGAGKSTLMKIVSGMFRADQGSIELGDEAVRFGSVGEANAAGVVLIHQEPRAFPDLTVIENIWIDDRTTGWWRRPFARKPAQQETAARLRELGCRASLFARMADLSVADQQLVDVASALRRDLRVLVVDEPTASLTPSEVESLFVVLRRLRDQGVAIIFIGHRLEEILEISDRVTVLRDGKLIRTVATADTDEEELVRFMVGRDIPPAEQRVVNDESSVALTVDGLGSPGVFEDISFQVKTGEILGLGGLVGAGRTEVLEAIFGVRPRSAGTVSLGDTRINSVAEAIRRGVALVPEDRGHHGLVLRASIRDNIIAPNLSVLSRFGMRDFTGERTLAAKMIEKLGVRTRSAEMPVGQLSGGNQQKVSLAKWLAGDLTVLLVDEPTRGVDVGAKAEIHALLRGLADRGLAIVVVSSDMRELMSISDRVIVMREGSFVGEMTSAEVTELGIIRLAAGVAA
jgi:ABC-type sugar transport system ATPase subunit